MLAPHANHILEELSHIKDVALRDLQQEPITEEEGIRFRAEILDVHAAVGRVIKHTDAVQALSPEERQQLRDARESLKRLIEEVPFWLILLSSIALGLGMISINPDYYLSATWLWLKIGGVLFLIWYHFQCGRYVKAALEERITHNHVFFRFFNEIPVLFLFAIVLLAVLKPW